MIEVFTWNTPNGQKPLILLEELELGYRTRPIDIGAGDQDADAFRAINPNGRIPALLDGRGEAPIRVFESGAILMHLCESAGEAGAKFLPTAPEARAEVLSWTFWQVGGPGPMMGQWSHFALFRDEKIEPAIARYRDESIRLMQVLDRTLDGRQFVAGEYSIADMMNWPWFSGCMRYMRQAGVDLPTLRRLRNWIDRVGERPAVQRAMAVAEGLGKK